MAEESGYLVEFLRKKGFSETRKTRHEYLSYYGLDQEYVYVLVSGVVKTCEGVRLITLDITNEDVAQFCGISSGSSVNRILRGFREKGIVSMRERGTRIVINEKERLERYVMGWPAGSAGWASPPGRQDGPPVTSARRAGRARRSSDTSSPLIALGARGGVHAGACAPQEGALQVQYLRPIYASPRAKEKTTMSAMQKLLKVTSIIMLALGGLFIPLAVMNFIHAETFPGIIIAVLTALTALFDILLGFLGSTAANVPTRVTGLLPIIVMALIVNAVSVLYIMLMEGLWVPTLVNATVNLVYSFAAHRVNKDALR